MRTRSALLGQLQQSAGVEVLIVGGGINGIGLYRDLAAQGVAALLVEQEDFCSGTSAAPSRLIHGGLRYLETGEFALVRESVEERNRLLCNAPHLVRPIPVWVPLRQWTAGLLQAPARFLRWSTTPGPKGALVTKLGLLVYDWFGRHLPVLPRHRLVGPREMRAAMPSLAADVQRAAEYYDARLLHPERLALELLMDAEHDCPAAMAVPYMALESHQGSDVLLRDTETQQHYRVRPRLVVNATGAWVDQANRCLGIEAQLMGGTRGSHLVLRHAALWHELAGRMVYFETADHRICLVYPLAQDLVLLGTTDIRSEQPDDKQCTPAEIDYLFDVLRVLMPRLDVSRAHIVFQYAGVRPLPSSQGKVAGAISRDHQLHHYPAAPGRGFDVLTLVGGKWTTYRVCAAQMADAVLARLQRPRRTDTAALPIGGGRDWPASPALQQQAITALAQQHAVDEALARRLWERYGTAAAQVLQTMATAGAGPVDGLARYCVGEIVHMARHERVTHLADVVLRRSLAAFEGQCSLRALQALATILGAELGWPAERAQHEIEQTSALLQARHAAKIDNSPTQPAP
ncbi:glycerol-3-phosphate dehydrogenase/oxidase [Xylophilus sp. GW821-FHT01B05]